MSTEKISKEHFDELLKKLDAKPNGNNRIVCYSLVIDGNHYHTDSNINKETMIKILGDAIEHYKDDIKKEAN